MIDITANVVRILDAEGVERGVFGSVVHALCVASELPEGDYTVVHDAATVTVTGGDVVDPPVEPPPIEPPPVEPPPVEPPPVEPPPVEPGDMLQVRFGLDNHVGVPLTGFTLPDVVVFKTGGYSEVAGITSGVVVGADGAVVVQFPAVAGVVVGDIVWLASAEAIGVYGQDGYETRGIMTQGIVEAV